MDNDNNTLYGRHTKLIYRYVNISFSDLKNVILIDSSEQVDYKKPSDCKRKNGSSCYKWVLLNRDC